MQSITEYGQNYTRFIEEMDTEIGKAAEGFVRIGYLLKVARDTDVLALSEYESVNDMAKKRYGLDKTQVSRFININDRFSEGGNSERLAEHYRGFGSSKLSIMLLLPDAVNEELTPEYSKAEIQTIKDEIDAENKVSDIEVMIEGEKKTTLELDDDLSKAVCQLGEDAPELFCQIFRAAADTTWCIEEIKEIMVPNGEKMYSIRVQGIGRLMLSMKEAEEQISLINVRSGEKTQYSWGNLMESWEALIDIESSFGPEKEWEMLYGKDFPKKEEVAPVQPEPIKRKESKVTKAKVEQPVKKEEPRVPEPVAEVEEQLPGQMEVSDYKEVLPDKQEQKAEDAPAEPVINAPQEVEKVEGEVVPTLAVVESEEVAAPTVVENVAEPVAVETDDKTEDLLMVLENLLSVVKTLARNRVISSAKKYIPRIERVLDQLEELN